jgi:predicted DNA-binding transcriptional regulator AlpA
LIFENFDASQWQTDMTEKRGDSVPWELQAIGAAQVGLLLGLAARTVLETIACKPDFPERLTMRPATWVAGEVLEWRDRNRVGMQKARAKKPRNV